MSEKTTIAVIGGHRSLAASILEKLKDIRLLDGDGNDITDEVPLVVIRHMQPNPDPDRFTMPFIPRREPISFLERFAPHNRGKRRARTR